MKDVVADVRVVCVSDKVEVPHGRHTGKTFRTQGQLQSLPPPIVFCGPDTDPGTDGVWSRRTVDLLLRTGSLVGAVKPLTPVYRVLLRPPRPLVVGDGV